MGFDSEWAEFHVLSRDLASADKQVADNVETALASTAKKVKASWRKKAERSGLKQYAATVDYEVKRFAAFGGAAVEVDIGPNLTRYGGKTGKGGLTPGMGFVEDAPGGVRSAPQHAGRDSLADNADDFERGISIAIGDLLDGLNL